jgi:Putative zinc-finger
MSHLGQRLSALVDGELGPAQRDRVLAHLARCESCRIEAASLRLLKQRMHTLGEATANSSLHERLLALAAMSGPPARGRWWRVARRRTAPRRPPGYPLAGRTRWPVRSLTLAGLMLLGAGVPAAAFLAGGSQQEPGPSVTPAVDLFVVQHAITSGQVPARTPPEQPGGTAAGRTGPAGKPGTAAGKPVTAAGKPGTAAGARQAAGGGSVTSPAPVTAGSGTYRRAVRSSPKLRVLSPTVAGAGSR